MMRRTFPVSRQKSEKRKTCPCFWKRQLSWRGGRLWWNRALWFRRGYQGRVQYLLPICLTDMEQPDLAMTLTIMDGYYLGNTCLTLEMAYLNARLLSRPVAHWLTDIVEE